jgi:hypothetical protein
MAHILAGIFFGSLAEAIGFTLWLREPGPYSLAWLILGGLLGWLFTALFVSESPFSHPRRTNWVWQANALLLSLAVFKILVWLLWYWTLAHAGGWLPQLPLTLATLVLLVGFHVKHVAGIVLISGRSIQPTFWNPLTMFASLAAAGGAAVWVAVIRHGCDVHVALVAWLVYAFVENLLQFMAGNLFEAAHHEQSPFSIVTEVDRGKVEEVKAVFQTSGSAPPAVLDVRRRFERYTRVHFCSFMLLEDDTAGATLVFEGNIDGPALTFLEDFASRDRAFLDRVYAGAPGYPIAGTPRDVADYLAENDYGASAMYVGQPGATRDQIERDQALRQLVEEELDANRQNYQRATADECRAAIQAFVSRQPDLAWTREPVPTLLRVRFGFNLLYAGLAGIVTGVAGIGWALASVDGHWALLLVVLAVSLGLVLVGIAYARWLRNRESTDVENREVVPLPTLQQLQSREDFQLQNHLVSITEAKVGWLRLLTMRAVLVAIGLLARFVATRGNLSGIVTIHFARWVVLTGRGRKPRLLFLSNYDGTWENYLGEFVDRASNGLTAVWSNTQLGPDRGFPSTRWLFLFGGSRDEQWFKHYARLSQRTDLLWYSAYPNLTMKHIANNREFRTGLYGPVSDVTRWLQRL